MTAVGDLAWLQDTSKDSVQTTFGAAYRDVVILDAWNRPIDPPFNLTSNDLGNESTREIFKNRLRQAGVLVDSDGDKIGDDWEERYLTGLGEGPEGDPDKDGEANLLEYALGSRPDQNSSRGHLSTGAELVEGGMRQYITFRRRLGATGGLNYLLQWSEDGELWTDAGERFELVEATNPYDGTGTEVVKFRATSGEPKAGLFRIKVTFP